MNTKDKLIKDKLSLALKMESTEVLDTIKQLQPNYPKAMEYYFDRLQNIFEKPVVTNGKKIVAHNCLQLPEEFIYAVDAVPVRICNGFKSLEETGSQWMPAKSCSLVKAQLGAINTSFFPGNKTPDLLVNTSSCDQKKKAPELIDNNDLKIVNLSLPDEKDSEIAHGYYTRSLHQTIKQLEKLSGKKLTSSRLAKAIDKINKARETFHKLLELRQKGPFISGTHALLVANSWFWVDADSWIDATSTLIEEITNFEQPVSHERSPRILMTGSPAIFPNIKTLLSIESNGGIIVADEFCSSGRLLYDAVAIDEPHLYDMVPAIADRYLKPCTCPVYTPNDDRLRKLKEEVQKYKIDGIVYQSLSGCIPYEMESLKVNRLADELKLPMLTLDIDFGDENEGQLNTRIEAFMESLKNKKRKAVI